MSARFEVVRSDAAQPWHARLRVNGEITWTTEQHTRKISAERAVRSLVAHVHGVKVSRVTLVANVPGMVSVIAGVDSDGTVRMPGWSRLMVAYVDERADAHA